MAILNFWSVGHFLQWTALGRFFLKSWPVFVFLSIGWELLELCLPFDFAREAWENKIADLVVNTIGFVFGLRMRMNTQQLE